MIDCDDIIGIDVGGANIKYARTDSTALDRCFPMWRCPGKLADTLADDLKRLGATTRTRLAVTMTGELADCFADRAVGVDHIVKHVQQAAQEQGITDVAYYGIDGQFHSAAQAVLIPDTIAAANWHALARFVAIKLCDSGLLIDIGSTTTDLIPIDNGHLATDAMTDFDRLTRSQLVYIGGRRTPVCAINSTLQYDGQCVPVMNEFFATIDDARILLRLQPELADDTDTADNQPRTIPCAANRIARMIGLDRRTVTLDQAIEMARQIVDTAKSRIASAITHPENGHYIVSGHCDDMIDFPTGSDVQRLSQLLGADLSRSAPAYAVADLRNAT